MSETTPAARAAEEENADLPALPSPLLDVVALAAALVAVVAIGLLIDIVAAAIAAGTSLAAWFVGRQGTVRGMRRDVHRLVGVVDSTPAALKDAPDAEGFGMLSPVAARVGRLQARLESAIEAATTDRLTHVANRPMLLAQLYDEVERSSRYGRPLTIAFIDIDHFKPINDTYGHDTGDVVLAQVARALREQVRRSDIVGRYGGEEFVIVFPETTVDEATSVAEKLRVLISKLRFDEVGDDLAVTVSIGLAGGHGQLLRVDDLLRDADAAMYAAKSLGRNQTYVFAEIDDDSSRIPRAPISPAAPFAPRYRRPPIRSPQPMP